MSLLFVSPWVRKLRKGHTPWDDKEGVCREDPRWSCAEAIISFYGTDELPEYLKEEASWSTNVLYSRPSRRERICSSWVYTSLDSVNDRIRIYK